jgi:hypothetical protein
MKNTKKVKPSAPRNFVAKHAQESGAGRHKDSKNDYRRQPKHRHQQLKSTMEN